MTAITYNPTDDKATYTPEPELNDTRHLAFNISSSEQEPPAYAEPNLNPTADEFPGEATEARNVPGDGEKGSPKKRQSLRERMHKVSLLPGKPLNKATNVCGAEGWWPSTLNAECVKAARILYSFTKLDPAVQPPNANGPMHPTGWTRKSMVKIPPKVLENCAGLAIFNTIRAGMFHGSLSGGSGIVIARREDGTWSPPSAFLVSSLGAGFVFGLDIYDCVCVLNTADQVAAFTKPQLALGGQFSVSVGPVGAGSALNAAVSQPARPAWSYIKSRGLWAGLQVDGTVIISRADANAAFYQQRGISAKQILHGDTAWPMGARPLFEVLKAIDGRKDLDAGVMAEVSTVDPTPEYSTFMDEKQDTPAPVVRVVDHDAEEENELPKYSDKEDLYAASVTDEKEKHPKAEQ